MNSENKNVLSESDQFELKEAFEESRAYDQILLAERRTRKKRTGLKLLWLTVFVLCLVLGLGMGVSSLKSTGEGKIASQPNFPEASNEVNLEGLNAEIASLESLLKKPGKSSDYLRLANAYRQRYQLSRESADQEAVTKYLIKAHSLLAKQNKEDNMFRNPFFFGSIFLLLVAAGIGLTVMGLYNGLVRTDEDVDKQWSQVETVLQRRLDLIPSLVNTVKGFAAHEQSTLTQVMEARAKMLSNLKAAGGVAPKAAASLKQIGEAQHSLSLAMGRLLAVVENYPDLKASTNFLSLQDQLEGTENRISVERKRYNSTVKNYNTKLRKFPSNVVGSMFGFEARAYFEAKDNADQPVEVKF